MNFLQRFHVATKYYSRFDYELVENIPMLLDKEISGATKPVGTLDYTIKEEGKVLPGSAEQCFLQMLCDGKDLPKKAMAFSSCFRNEKETTTNFKHFHKLELFVNLNKYKDIILTDEDITDMAKISAKFFEKFLKKVRVIKTGQMEYDIVDNEGLELGSYGYRRYKSFNWLYGTGLAEPRLGMAIASQKQIKQVKHERIR